MIKAKLLSKKQMAFEKGKESEGMPLERFHLQKTWLHFHDLQGS